MKRRLFKGRVKTSTDTSLGKDASKQGRSSDKTKLMFIDSDFDVLDAEQITTTGPSHVSTANQVGTTRPEVSDASVPVNDSAATPSTPPTTTVFDDEDVTMAMGLNFDQDEGIMVKKSQRKVKKHRSRGLAQLKVSRVRLQREEGKREGKKSNKGGGGEKERDGLKGGKERRRKGIGRNESRFFWWEKDDEEGIRKDKEGEKA
ncbi:hypothetical protein Tco_0564786 [Tanacetum coccineum]